MGFVERSMLTAIEERLGTPYRMGATGPYRYDCSGFVWSVFQQAGVAFERTPVRSLWQEFAVPADDEKFKFGTLVFFNNLHHVGIVADANGFYITTNAYPWLANGFAGAQIYAFSKAQLVAAARRRRDAIAREWGSPARFLVAVAVCFCLSLLVTVIVVIRVLPRGVSGWMLSERA